MFATDDTIVAIATPPGRRAHGVVRLSGPAAARVAGAIIDRRTPLEPRHATLARIVTVDGRGNATRAPRAVDEVIVTSFPAPHSHTGEDVLEISAHGSAVVLEEIVRCAVRAGARLARPGEFTLRAFLNGRLDLIQAEAVADLIESITPAQARQAFDQLEGTLTERIGSIERDLFDLVARLEASVDFPDEGYHFVEPGATAAAAAAIAKRIDVLLATAGRGRMIREGAHAVILGRTNVGKSSVFNSLIGSNRAIVTPHPGTTRDLITERISLDGLLVTLVDTAGLRVTPDEVEVEGVDRARQAGAVADLAIVVLDRSTPLEPTDLELLARTAGSARVVVVNKCDLPAAWCVADVGLESPVEVSLLTGARVGMIRPAMVRAFEAQGCEKDTPAISNIRHIGLLERAKDAMTAAATRASEGAPEEIVLVELQQARAALEEICGRRTSEDVLARIFERFCIGK